MTEASRIPESGSVVDYTDRCVDCGELWRHHPIVFGMGAREYRCLHLLPGEQRAMALAMPGNRVLQTAKAQALDDAEPFVWRWNANLTEARKISREQLESVP